ncbi:hypothetical protein ACDQ55_06770 [Chitinophaga sp. 30R24]|uniref:hypothetical protein n=1 Tax=Chitinophaga sp. 30R24 TaxID=3248838 RepID=UPI003B8EE75B
MEKINALIEKLQELKNSGADLTAISYYVQLLQAEVLHERTLQHQQKMQASQGNIAVIMPVQPAVSVTIPTASAAQTTTLPSNKPAATYPAPETATPITVPDTGENTPAPLPAQEIPSQPEPVIIAQPIPTLAASTPPAEPLPKVATLFDDIPPVTPQQSPARGEIRKDLNELVSHHADKGDIKKDLNEIASNNNSLSLNDRLRQQQVELAQKLGDTPINDLRQAIGINDKYQFIQELFHGDSDLYERSIKTINECGNLHEADYWIQREIKIIQGWEDDHHLVQHFYSLLRKRFS